MDICFLTVLFSFTASRLIISTAIPVWLDVYYCGVVVMEKLGWRLWYGIALLLALIIKLVPLFLGNTGRVKYNFKYSF